MAWIGGALAGGGALLGGLLGADAASSAADAQIQASREAAAVQREMFNKTLEIQQPYRAAGYDALNELRSMLSGKYTAYDENGKPIPTGGGTSVNQLAQGGGGGGRQYVPDVKYVGGNQTGGGYTPIGYGSKATVGDSAADAWVQSHLKPIDISNPAGRNLKAEREALYQEYYAGGDGSSGGIGGFSGGSNAGVSGVSGAGGEDLTGSGYLTRQFTAEDFEKGVDPGYAFRLKEGLKAIDRSAAARGGLLGGNQMRGLIDYGQGAASQEYTNAFNRFQTERSNIYNNLAGIAGIGQTSANTVSNAAGNLGNSLGENYIGAGNARASGYIGGANAISGAIGQGINYYNQNQMLNRMFPQAGATLPNYAGSVTTNNFIP